MTIAVTGKVSGQDLPQPVEYKIDLTKPFDPTQANGPLPPGAEMQVEKVKQDKERVEKVKVGDKTYDARVDVYKTKVKAGGMDFESRDHGLGGQGSARADGQDGAGRRRGHAATGGGDGPPRDRQQAGGEEGGGEEGPKEPKKP